MAVSEIRLHYQELYNAEKKVADYILEHPNQVVDMSMAQLSRATATSDATIVRLCHRIGFDGFYQTKLRLASYLAQNAESGMEGTMDSTQQGVQEFFSNSCRNLGESMKTIQPETFRKCVDLIEKAGTVYATAWGNTNEIASDFAHRVTLKGIPSFVSDTVEYTIRSLSIATEKDVLVAISHSGENAHVIMALEAAKERHIPSILITCTKDSPAGSLADYQLCASGGGSMFRDMGGSSHLAELMIVDALLYYVEKRSDEGANAEILLSRYRI